MKRLPARIILPALVLLVGVALWLKGGFESGPQPKSPALRIPRNRMSHDSPVRSVAYSPDGKTLASSSHDGTIKLWDVATSKELASLKGHNAGAVSVAYSPAGQMLASGSDDRTLMLCDVRRGREGDGRGGAARAG